MSCTVEEVFLAGEGRLLRMGGKQEAGLGLMLDPSTIPLNSALVDSKVCH